MTDQEFKQALEELGKEYERKERELVHKCAKSKQLYHVGDVIEDKLSKHRILIKKCHASHFFGLVDVYYSGVLLNKNGSPNKRGHESHILQGSAVLIKRGEKQPEG
jgi:hypothetical protein